MTSSPPEIIYITCAEGDFTKVKKAFLQFNTVGFYSRVVPSNRNYKGRQTLNSFHVIIFKIQQSTSKTDMSTGQLLFSVGLFHRDYKA